MESALKVYCDLTNAPYFDYYIYNLESVKGETINGDKFKEILGKNYIENDMDIK